MYIYVVVLFFCSMSLSQPNFRDPNRNKTTGLQIYLSVLRDMASPFLINGEPLREVGNIVDVDKTNLPFTPQLLKDLSRLMLNHNIPCVMVKRILLGEKVKNKTARKCAPPQGWGTWDGWSTEHRSKNVSYTLSDIFVSLVHCQFIKKVVKKFFFP